MEQGLRSPGAAAHLLFPLAVAHGRTCSRVCAPHAATRSTTRTRWPSLPADHRTVSVWLEALRVPAAGPMLTAPAPLSSLRRHGLQEGTRGRGEALPHRRLRHEPCRLGRRVKGRLAGGESEARAHRSGEAVPRLVALCPCLRLLGGEVQEIRLTQPSSDESMRSGGA